MIYIYMSGEKMKLTTERIILILALIVFFVYIGIAVNFLLIGQGTEKVFEITGLAIGMISIALGALGFGFALISSYVSKDAKKIAEGSDKKLIEIQNSNFLSIIQLIENARQIFLANEKWIETYTWKTLSALEMALEFDLNNIKPQNQHRLVKYFCINLEVLGEKGYVGEKIDSESRANLKNSYKLIQKFKMSRKTYCKLLRAWEECKIDDN